MASHHHTHNPHHPTCCCRYSCCASSHPSLLSPSPSPSLSDSLLQIIASHLLQSPPPNFQSKYQHLHHQQTQTQTQSQSQTQTLLLLQSLLSRVSALESSLHHLSSPPSQTPPPPPPPSQTSPPPPLPSLRNLAARTIQTHFRAFLVRRSQTLRNLKDLATIRSNFVSLKSSLLDEAHHTPDAVSQEASDLLIKLDSIQSRDSLINEGKRAIRAELSQFLESVEGLSAKCHSNLPPKLKKRVTFAENAIPAGADSARNIKSEEVREFLSVGQNEEDGCHPEMEGFHNQMSDGIFKNGLKGNFQGQIGNFGFDHSFDLPNMGMGNEFGYGMNRWGYAPWPMNGDLGKLSFTAPMPVQMEKRANDYLKERLFDNPGKW
ncbi:hypothetical protein AAC387_Pa02g1526 [Persea americana]